MEEPSLSEIEMIEIEGELEKSAGECPGNGNTVCSREAEGPIKQDLSTAAAERLKSKLASSDPDDVKNERKLSRQDRIELRRLFQGALSSPDWDLAESLILLADPQTLNDALCVSLDSIWFLSTRQELCGITRMIKMIVGHGAYDFTRAALRTSFLASCVAACQSRTMFLADNVIVVMSQRLNERLQECNGDEVLKAEAGAKVQKFTEWALKCISFHSRSHRNMNKVCHNSAVEIQLQLCAFKTFLDLAGNHLSGKDFSEAFDAACFPLTLFSSTFDHGWASGASASAVQGLLGMLVERGADNVNQCFLEASRFGSTELVRILLQIALRNSLDVDVDLALGFASHYSKLNTMECLVDEGHAVAFLGPLMRAAERGSMPVVRWFLRRGCRDMELCLALTAATSSSQVEVAAHLLPRVPRHVLASLGIEILKAAGERSCSGGSLHGVAFLLRSDFLGDPVATYAVSDSIARSDEEAVAPELRAFLQEHWSEAAYSDGLVQGEVHFTNVVRILRRGESGVRLGDLPGVLRVAVAYLPLYRECGGGGLLSQRLRGQLVEAARRLGGVVMDGPGQATELMAVLEHHLPRFLAGGSGVF